METYSWPRWMVRLIEAVQRRRTHARTHCDWCDGEIVDRVDGRFCSAKCSGEQWTSVTA